MTHYNLLRLAEWKGADSTATYIPGGNDARVVLNLNADSNMLFALRESPSDSSAYVEVPVNGGVVYVQPHDGGSGTTYSFHLYNLEHTYGTFDRGWNIGVTYHRQSERQHRRACDRCLPGAVLPPPRWRGHGTAEERSDAEHAIA